MFMDTPPPHAMQARPRPGVKTEPAVALARAIRRALLDTSHNKQDRVSHALAICNAELNRQAPVKAE